MHPPLSKVAVIYNPTSGSGSAQRVFETLKKTSFSQIPTCDVFPTKSVPHLFEICSTLDVKSYDTVIIIGGDGTFHLTATGFLTQPRNLGMKFLFVNGGTGNDFHAGIQGLLLDQIPLRIKAPTYYPIDIGQVKFTDSSTGKLETKYFVDEISFGVTAMVADLALRKLRWLKSWQYDVGAIIEIIRNRTVRLDLALDDNPLLKDTELTMFHIQNV
jgi:diacylglycerol kinase (ATP)